MKTHNTLKVAILSALLSIPFFTYAGTDFSSLGTLVNNFTKNVVTAVGYLFLSGAVVVFFFGVVQFMWAARSGEGDGMTKGKAFMMWGLVALFVMFSVWGIIKFAQGVLGDEFKSTVIDVPMLRFNPAGGAPATTPLNNGGAPASGSLLPDGSSCSSSSQCSSGYCALAGGTMQCVSSTFNP